MDRAPLVRSVVRGIAAAGATSGIGLATLAWMRGDAVLVPVLAVMFGPAVLAWLRPTPRSIGIWAILAWIPSLLCLLAADRTAIAAWLSPAVAALLGILPLAGHAAAAALAESRTTAHQLARKLRSVTAVAFTLAVVTAVIAFLPGRRMIDGGTATVGGIPMLVLIALTISPGIVVYASPTRANAWRWAMFALCLGAPGAIAWLAVDGDWSDLPMMWPMRAAELGLGTLLVTIVVVQSIVLIAARGVDDPGEPALPEARAIRPPTAPP
jgi:hypothetical protein